MAEYEHSEHGEMEWYECNPKHRDILIEGWKCNKCGVIAPPEDADEVFDSHDCENYQSVTEGITETL